VTVTFRSNGSSTARRGVVTVSESSNDARLATTFCWTWVENLMSSLTFSQRDSQSCWVLLRCSSYSVSSRRQSKSFSGDAPCMYYSKSVIAIRKGCSHGLRVKQASAVHGRLSQKKRPSFSQRAWCPGLLYHEYVREAQRALSSPYQLC